MDKSRPEMVGVMAALEAAISLLERSPKTAAPSDRMFDAMLADYRRALDNASAALSSAPSEPATPAPGDMRPANCRRRLMDERKGYPRSGCWACETSVLTRLQCPYEKPATPAPGGDNAG